MFTHRIISLGLLAATGVVTAGAAANASSSPHDFTVTAHRGSETNVDLGRHGFSAGDIQLFTARLTRDGAPAGRLVGRCTAARVTHRSADMLCEYVLSLPGGRITAIGTQSSGPQGPGAVALPVVGGTGAYDTAAGHITVTPSNGPALPIRVSLR